MAIVYYVTNYATKVEDPVWRRVAASAESFPVMAESPSESQGHGNSCAHNKTRRFLMKVANRIFTERALSQVEVAAHLLRYPTEFTSNAAWTFLNACVLYWHIFRRWRHLRRESGMAVAGEPAEDTVLLEEAGQRISFIQAYPHRGKVLQGLSLYDYMSIVQLKRKGKSKGAWGEIEFDSHWSAADTWVQVLRKPGRHAVVCFDGYLSMDMDEEDDGHYKRAAVQHLGLFIPWETFLSEVSGRIDEIWQSQRQALPRRLRPLADNIQLLHRSPLDAKRDARQWAAQSGDSDPSADMAEGDLNTGDGEEGRENTYCSGGFGTTTRLIDVLRQAISRREVTGGSNEISTMIEQLSRFQQSAMCPTDDIYDAMVSDEGPCLRKDAPVQDLVRSIKSQQLSVSREKERLIQGIQRRLDGNTIGGESAAYILDCTTEQAAVAELDVQGRCIGPSAAIQFGSSTSFSEAGRQLGESYGLNRKQSTAFHLICRQLDHVHRDENQNAQFCQFIRGEGGTGKSRIIATIAELFASKGIPHRLLVTATSGTAAANINGITIHSACGLTKDARGGRGADIDGLIARSSGLRVDGRSTAEWQEKWLLIIDEVSMLGARTLYIVNDQLCKLRGCTEDFGGIPIVLFCGDFHQFRPVKERSIHLPSTAILWDEEKSFKAEQRHQHDKAHALWNNSLRWSCWTNRQGVQDKSDVEFLNRACYQEGRRIPWESRITVVTPLNKNRWNLNMEAAIAFQKQQQVPLRIFVSEHRWKDNQPTEEEALMMMSYGDDSAIPAPAFSLFVPGMPVIVNRNTLQGLKLVNGASYTALDVVLDKAYPGHRINAETILHFGPPAGIVLASETTKGLHFVGMPADTLLLTPISTKIECL